MLLREADVTAEQVSAWLAWTRDDTRNLQAFERVSDLAEGLGALDPAVKAMLARELLAEREPVPEPARPRRRVYYALAAGVLAAAVMLGYYTLPRQSLQASPGAIYATARAESRNFVLPDGTRVALSARSRLKIHFTATRRVVELSDGEAYFQVKHNAKRPFIVHAGELRLADIGTAFDVRKTGDYVAIAVADGIVAVSHAGATAGGAPAAKSQKTARPLKLIAGQGVSTDGAGGKLKVANVNTDKVASWRVGRLRFRDTPLSVVIANVNRYTSREIVIADQQVGRMRYTGTVFVHKIDDWLAATRRVFALREVEIGRGERVLLYRVAAAKNHMDDY